MTYLAAEILLYLLVTAVIGFVLGWLVWGAGRGRQMAKIRSEHMMMIDHERQDHQETRDLLRTANQRLDEAVSKGTAETEGRVAELQSKVNSERAALKEAHTALEVMRVKLDEAIRTGQTASDEALLKVNKDVEIEKARAAQATANEAKAQAELEELRLTVGAEKLQADNARVDFEDKRRQIEVDLQTERAAHQQAKSALNDIRSTLARTLGPAAAHFGTDDAPLPNDDKQPSAESPPDIPIPSFLKSDTTPPDEALNNPDPDEVDSEDREEATVDLPSGIDVDEPADSETVIGESIDGKLFADRDVIGGERGDREIGNGTAAIHPDPASMLIPNNADIQPSMGGQPSLDEQPSMDEPTSSERPIFLHTYRPDRVDDLQAIDGIGAALETKLHDVGCYHFNQLAAMTPAHVDWLARTIDLPSERIKTERWVEQARLLRVHSGEGDSGGSTQAAG